MGCNVLIRDIGPALDPHCGDHGVAGGELEACVGDQHSEEIQALRRPEDEVLHIPGGGIRINPDSQRRSLPIERIERWNTMVRTATITVVMMRLAGTMYSKIAVISGWQRVRLQ
jgi:hypothetical protein